MDESGRLSDEEFFGHKADSEEESGKEKNEELNEEFEELPLSEEEPETVEEDVEEMPVEPPSKGSLIEQFKKLPKRTQIIVGAATGCVLLVAVSAYFLFGGESKPKRPQPVNLHKARQDKQTKSPVAVPGENGAAEKQEDADAPEPVPEEPVEEEPVPQRPEDFAAWKAPDDYVAARVEDDPQLVDAVAFLGEACRGNANAPQAAELLASLLAPRELSEEEGRRTGPRTTRRPATRSRGATDTTDAIVAALVSLDDNRARELLLQLLSGKLPSEDDTATVEAVLEALAAAGGLANEGLLYRVFTQANQLRPGGESGLSAEQLREKAYETIEPVASERLRIELAKYLQQPTIPMEHRERFGEMLYAQDSRNVAAQMFLWQSSDLEESVAEAFWAHFLGRSSAAMAHVLGLPGESFTTSRGRRPAPRSKTRKPVEPVDEAGVHLRMSQLLWGQWFVGQLEQRLAKVDSLADHVELIMLGATIPVDSMRAAVYEAIKDHWKEGPDSLDSARPDGKLVVDPVLLLSIKALPRSEARDTTRTPSRSSSARSSKRGGRSKTSVSETLQEQEKTQQAWMQTSEAMVRTWCQRLHAESQNRVEAARLAGKTPQAGHAVESLKNRAGLQLHQDAKVTAEYHHVYPGALASQLAGLPPGPVSVDYVRVEEEGKGVAMSGYYRRQLGVRDIRTLEDGGWIDLVRTVPQTDRKRSIDVLITRPDPDSEPDDEGVEPLVIEILAIEAKDPTGG